MYIYIYGSRGGVLLSGALLSPAIIAALLAIEKQNLVIHKLFGSLETQMISLTTQKYEVATVR